MKSWTSFLVLDGQEDSFEVLSQGQIIISIGAGLLA